MATNFTQCGNVINFTAPTGGVTSGLAVLIGALLAVPVADAAEGELFAGQVVGVFAIAKATGAVTEGQKLYWNNTNNNLTTTASSNVLVGVATAAAASGDATVQVRLDGVAR